MPLFENNNIQNSGALQVLAPALQYQQAQTTVTSEKVVAESHPSVRMILHNHLELPVLLAVTHILLYDLMPSTLFG